MKTTKAPERLPLQNYFAETLRETLEGGDVSQIRIATATGIPPSHLTQMKKGRRRCTPEYDLRLSKFYGIAPGYFLRLQMAYEIERVECEKGPQIALIRPLAHH